MSFRQFCVEAQTHVRAIMFATPNEVELIRQYLRDPVVSDRALYFTDAEATAVAVELAGFNSNDYCFVGAKCRLPFWPLERDPLAPGIYIACCSAYNNGRLHGMWIDATKDPDDIQDDIDYMLSYSPEDYAESWAVHDYDNFGGINLGEYPSLERISTTANAIAEYGKAYSVYYNYFGGEDYCTPEDFQERYQGCYKDEEEFAYELWEQCGKLKQLEEIGVYDSYIDWERIANDLFISDYLSVEVSYNETYVFNRN